MNNDQTTAHIPDEAIHDALIAFENTARTKDGIIAAIYAVLPHLSAPCAVEVLELIRVLEPFASRADRYNDSKAVVIRDCVELWQIARNEGMRVDLTVGQLRAARDLYERLSSIDPKPVDVAAVRRQAFEEAAKEQLIKDADWLGDYAHQLSEEECDHHDGGYTVSCLQAISDRIRALSPAEPAQGDQWHSGLGRLPTLQEAQQAARVLNACNGVDLSDWTDDLWPCDDLTEGLKALLTTAPTSEAGK